MLLIPGKALGGLGTLLVHGGKLEKAAEFAQACFRRNGSRLLAAAERGQRLHEVGGDREHARLPDALALRTLAVPAERTRGTGPPSTRPG
jgi:hypothetical protein